MVQKLIGGEVRFYLERKEAPLNAVEGKQHQKGVFAESRNEGGIVKGRTGTIVDSREGGGTSLTVAIKGRERGKFCKEPSWEKRREGF